MKNAASNLDEKPLRIVQYNTLFKGGGVDNQTLELGIGLHQCGQKVWMAIPAGRSYEPPVRQAGVPVFHVSARNRFHQIYGLGRFLWRERIQILHAHHGRDYWTAILAARTSGRRVKVVLSRHLATPPRRASRWALLRGCDALVSVSEFVDKEIRNAMCGNTGKIHRVYGGIDTGAFESVPPDQAAAWRQKQGWTPENVVCGVVGTFSFPRGKGQPEFLQAAQRLHPSYPTARFAMIGTGSMKAFLEQEIRRLGLEDVAKLIPYSFEMPVVMNGLDVLVHPAVGTEALGLVLWEAMASGKPVVASRLGGIPEAFIENEHGLLVESGDVDALTVALGSLLGDGATRKRMGVSGQRYVRDHFSRKQHAQNMLALYSRAIFKSS